MGRHFVALRHPLMSEQGSAAQWAQLCGQTWVLQAARGPLTCHQEHVPYSARRCFLSGGIACVT